MTCNQQIRAWMAGREDEFVEAPAPLIAIDSRLHGANERARISQLLLTAQIYAAVIVRLCGA